MTTKEDYLKAKKIVQDYESKHLNISDIKKSSPLVEGRTKSKVKNSKQTRKLAPPPPSPIKR